CAALRVIGHPAQTRLALWARLRAGTDGRRVLTKQKPAALADFIVVVRRAPALGRSGADIIPQRLRSTHAAQSAQGRCSRPYAPLIAQSPLGCQTGAGTRRDRVTNLRSPTADAEPIAAPAA